LIQHKPIAITLALNIIRLVAITLIVAIIATPFKLAYNNTYKGAKGNMLSK
jgi:hypothetical protein